MMLDDSGLAVVSRELDPDDPRISQWRRAEFSLVTVFSDSLILRKHSLVKVR